MIKPIFRRDENETMQPLTEGFIIIDTEDDTKGKAYLFGVMSKDGFKHFNTAKDLLVYVGLRPEKYVFCYNLTYDIFNILGYKLFDYDYFFIDSRIAKVKCFGKTWLDAYNHWAISVEQAGEVLGLKKIEVTDYKKRVSIKYLRRDCEIEYKFTQYMLKVYAENNIEYKLTIASTALYNFLQYSQVNPKIDNLYLQMFKAYFGGRVGVFKRGVFKKVFYYDINSAYPYVMQKEKYPYPLITNSKPNLGYDGITHCRVFSDMDIPILPYRNEKREIFFPNGTFDGIWCNNELNYFKSKGGKILKIYNGLHFKASEYVFKNWVLETYQKRLNAKDYFSRTCFKTILNSLYGKFSQRSIETRVVNITDKNLELYEGDIVNNRLIINEYGGFPNHTNCIWSAMITSNVRIYLHKHLDMLGIKNVLYCDTDSIISLKELPKGIINQTKLGAFKLEKTGACEIIAPKVYKFNDDVRIKGVPKRAIKNNTITKVYHFERPIKLLEGLRRDIRPNIWISDKKELTFNLKNCNIDKNGIITPLKINDKNKK